MFNKAMENINYTEYDRITDTIMFLSDDIVLNFSVALSRKNRNGDRIFYHYETVYGSDNYGNSLRSIKRSMNFYFILDIKSDFNAGTILRPQDVEILSRLISSKVLPWYFGNDQEVAFQIISNKLVLSDYQPVSYIQATKYDNKIITFEPVVVVENELECRGIRISLQSGHSAELSIDKFMGFFHLITYTDMYTLAATMCNYVKSGPYGINPYINQGLGAQPPTTLNSFRTNSFLNNAKSNKEGE